ncbi:guanine nucleotide binding protein, alpha subunit [Mycena olivaceomarginata]|nr:guanine nucleotide binding protein, alpha subunit [Mycena olivaceomarginata]
MKIIHHGGFDKRERTEYRTTIYKNVLDSAEMLARVVRRVGLGAFDEGIEREYAMAVLTAFPPVPGAPGDDSSVDGSDEGDIEVGVDPIPFTRVEEHAYAASAGLGTAEVPTPVVDVFAQTHAVLTPALADAIWHVASAPAVERFVDEHSADSYLMDSAVYFFSSIHRIADPTYVPTQEDVLRARAKSTAVIETRFWMGDLMIKMVDVGGQRSERKKWIHCFEGVTSIIFCVALSDYDQVLEEERRVNRMRESLYLFESVINSRWFLRTSVILLLNKIDVFKRKLPKIPLERYFPEYAGGNDLQKAAKYILWKFMQENRAKLAVYPHITQATNKKNIRLVFAAVKETIRQTPLKNLKNMDIL